MSINYSAYVAYGMKFDFQEDKLVDLNEPFKIRLAGAAGHSIDQKSLESDNYVEELDAFIEETGMNELLETLLYKDFCLLDECWLGNPYVSSYGKSSPYMISIRSTLVEGDYDGKDLSSMKKPLPYAGLKQFLDFCTLAGFDPSPDWQFWMTVS